MAEDRLDQKLTLTCNDGRSIDGDLNLGGLPDWPALTTFVISITLILFLAQWSFRFEEVDPAVEYKGQSEAFWRCYRWESLLMRWNIFTIPFKDLHQIPDRRKQNQESSGGCTNQCP